VQVQATAPLKTVLLLPALLPQTTPFLRTTAQQTIPVQQAQTILAQPQPQRVLAAMSKLL
jgi:hypothetical protein